MNYPEQGYPSPSGKDPRMLVAILVVVFAALVGLGITGFVTPGFFLGDDESSADGTTNSGGHHTTAPAADDGGTTTTESTPATTAATTERPGPETGKKLVDQFVTAVNSGDRSTALGLTCESKDLSDDIEESQENGPPNIVLSTDQSKIRITDSTYDVMFSSAPLKQADGLLGARFDKEQGAGGAWCVDTFSF